MINETELTEKLREFTIAVGLFYEKVAAKRGDLLIAESRLKDREVELATTSMEYAALSNEAKRSAWMRSQTTLEQEAILKDRVELLRLEGHLDSAKIKRDYYATMIRLLIASKEVS